jgi:hypothetical protein
VAGDGKETFEQLVKSDKILVGFYQGGAQTQAEEFAVLEPHAADTPQSIEAFGNRDAQPVCP